MNYPKWLLIIGLIGLLLNTVFNVGGDQLLGKLPLGGLGVDGKITDVKLPTNKIYNYTTTVPVSATFLNTGILSHSFWVGCTVEDLNGIKYDIPAVETLRLIKPGEIATVELSWDKKIGKINNLAPEGLYKITVALWRDRDRNTGDMIGQLGEPSIKPDAFRLSSTGIGDANKDSGLQVEIKDPENGQGVPNLYIVHGTINKKLPDNKYMWLLVGNMSHGEWWPQRKDIIPIDGEWEKEASIGGPDIGAEYKLVVMLVDKKVNEEFNDWMEKGIANNNYPPLDYPTGEFLGGVSVIRIKGV